MYRWQKFFLKFLPNNPICMKHSLMFWSFVCFAAYFLVYNCHLRRALLKLYLGKHSRLNRQITANTWKPCLTNPIVGFATTPQKGQFIRYQNGDEKWPNLHWPFFTVRLPTVQGRLARLFSFFVCLTKISRIAVGGSAAKSFTVESDRVGLGNFFGSLFFYDSTFCRLMGLSLQQLFSLSGSYA